MPIALSGRDATGEKFREECRTVSINRQGAAIATSRLLKLGAEVVVENVPLGMTARARVVRFTRNSSSGELHQVGVELAEIKNVWGIKYPPPDWRLPPSPTPKTEPATPRQPERVIEVDLSGPLTPVDAGPEASANPSTAAPAATPATALSAEETDRSPKADEAELARIASEIEAKLEARAEEALARLNERQSSILALEERLGAIAKAASDASTGLESLLARAQEAGERSRDEMEKAQAGLQKASEELVKSFTLDLGRMLSEGVEGAAPALMANLKSQAAQETSVVAEKLRRETSAALARAAEEALSSSATQLEGLHARVVAEAEKRVALSAEAASESALGRIRETARTFEESTFPEMVRECASRAAADVETKQAAALKEVNAHAAAVSADVESRIKEFRTELDQAAEGLREATLATLRQDFAVQSAQEIEKARALASTQARDHLDLAVRTTLENFQAEAEQAVAARRDSALQSVAQSVSKAAAELDARRAQLLEEANSQTAGVSAQAQSRIEAFRAELEQAAAGLRDTVLAGLSQEFAAQSSGEMEKARAAASSQARDELEGMARAALEAFRGQVEQAASASRDSAVQSVTQSASSAASEIEAKRKQILEDVHSQVSTAQADAQSKFEAFRTDLAQAAEGLRDSTLTSLSQEFAAQSAAALKKANASAGAQAKDDLERMTGEMLGRFRAQLEQAAATSRESAAQSVTQLASLAASEIDAKRAQLLHEFGVQASATSAAAKSELETFRREMQKAAEGLRDSTLAALSQDFTAQSAKEIEKARALTGSQAQSELDQMAHVALESFRRQVEQAAAGDREEIVSKIAGECVERSAQELANRQSSAIKQAEEQIQATLSARIEGFQLQLDGLSEKFKEHAGGLIEQPLQTLAKHVEETALAARGKADALRKDAVEEVRAQFGAMVRGALASMTEESKAFTEEYRAQLRDTFETIKAKSASEIKSQVQQALQEVRETALRQVQKDAEDFGMVAVEQFRAKSAEAVREASDAVHKQVGAAAFVVKDWQDQVAQRLESYSDRLQKESDAASAALHDRSRSLSEVVLEEFKKESEALIQNLRRRIRTAADALAGEVPEEGNRSEEKGTLRPSPEQPADYASPTPYNNSGR